MVVEKNCRWCGAKIVVENPASKLPPLCERCTASRDSMKGSSIEPGEIVSEEMIDLCCRVLGIARGEFWHHKLNAFKTVVIDASIELYRGGVVPYDGQRVAAFHAPISDLLAVEAQASKDLQKHRRTP